MSILKNNRVLLTLTCVGLAFLLASSGESALPENQTQKKALDNGLTVLVNEMPSSPSVAVYALVKVGGATEGEFLGAGLSHFMEHMLFKGTHDRSVGEIAAEVQALGGRINATTGLDYTYYMINVPRQHYARAVEIISDMLMNAVFDEQEIEREREVIFNEMRMHNDRPSRVLSRMVFESVFHRHPYRVPVIGFEELLANITRDDFLRFYKTRYVPNNIIFSVAGQVEADKVFTQVEGLFKDAKRGILQPRNLPLEPAQIGLRSVDKTFNTNQTRLSLTWRGVSVTDVDMPALDVLASILGRGRSSRLYRDLFKEKGLVRSVRAFNYTPIDSGVFEIGCEVESLRVDEVVNAVKGHIQQIAEKGVSAPELEKVKTQVISSYIFNQQTADEMAYLAAVNEAMVGDIDFSRKYIKKVEALSVQDVQEVCARYLVDDRLTIAVLRPDQVQEASAAPQAVEVSDIKKFVLDNGLTVLLKSNPRLPILSISLALNGGTRFESLENNGISELTARLWTKGTKKRSADMIAEQVESRGGRLGGFSGRNSLGLKMDFLAKDQKFALDLLEDLVKNAEFRAQELTKVKDKVRTAILRRDDNITAVTGMRFKKALFGNHPISFELLGSEDSIAKINAENISAFFEPQKDPSNMVLAVFGDIELDQMEEEVRRRFGTLKDKQDTVVPVRSLSPVEERVLDVSMDKKQAMLMMGFRAVRLDHEDRYAMEVLSSILGSPFNGRIFNQVRDQFGKAYSAGGAFLPSLDAGMIYFYALTDEESLEYVEQKVLEIIEELRAKGITEEELKTFKTYLKGNHEMGLETNSALGFISSLDELYGLGYDLHERYPQAIDQVTPEVIQRLAEKYLDPALAVVVRTRPTIGEEVPSSQKAAADRP